MFQLLDLAGLHYAKRKNQCCLDSSSDRGNMVDSDSIRSTHHPRRVTSYFQIKTVRSAVKNVSLIFMFMSNHSVSDLHQSTQNLQKFIHDHQGQFGLGASTTVTFKPTHCSSVLTTFER